MSRKADQERLEALKEAIRAHPGECAGFFARLLGWRREKVSRALTVFQDAGILVSEDERGGLWPFAVTAQPSSLRRRPEVNLRAENTKPAEPG